MHGRRGAGREDAGNAGMTDKTSTAPGNSLSATLGGREGKVGGVAEPEVESRTTDARAAIARSISVADAVANDSRRHR